MGGGAAVGRPVGTPAGTPVLSVCLIVKDEEQNLPRVLRSVRGVADEIIVVDTGSGDASVEVARAEGARVVFHPWSGDFSAARNRALDEAAGDWVLMLDADEELTPTAAAALPGLLARPKAHGYLLTLINVYPDGGRTRAPVLRLFRRDRRYRYQFRIHEQIAPAIAGAGGSVASSNLEVLHYGYSEAEDRRKDRRARNLTALRREIEERPERGDLWYYLGAEYVKLLRLDEAASCLRRKIETPPFDDLSALSAAILAELLLTRERGGEAWVVALRGLGSSVAHCDCLLALARAARLEGDHLALDDCVSRLRAAPANAPGQAPRTAALFADLEASSLWEQERFDEALGTWERAVATHPVHAALADRWVGHLVRAKGLRRATALLLDRDTTSGSGAPAGAGVPSPAVVAAVAGALLRGGETELAVGLVKRLGDHLRAGPSGRRVASPHVLHCLAHLGRWDEASEIADDLGVEGPLHLATAAVIRGEAKVQAAALERLPEFWRGPLRCALEKQPVPDEQREGMYSLLTCWAASGCGELVSAGARAMAGSVAETGSAGRAALILYRAHQVGAAVEMAAAAEGDPVAMEVLGLCAYDAGEWDLAGRLLEARAAASGPAAAASGPAVANVLPASVRAYHRAALSLARTGQVARARGVLELGAERCPWSRLLAVAARGLSPDPSDPKDR
jgi:tetratricopeptide (TPR) repeat protein